jgi:hypothetical protein
VLAAQSEAGPFYLATTTLDTLALIETPPVYLATTTLDTLALIETPPDQSGAEGGSNSVRRWRRRDSNPGPRSRKRWRLRA